MGLFGKKKDAAADASVSTSKKGKRDGLASVVDESVPERALELFKTNDSFIVEVDGEDKYVGLLLDTETIGGFGRKAVKDEDKGSILEMIRNNQLSIYATPELLAEEKFIIIPTDDTLANMEEYGILTGAQYSVALVAADGSFETTETAITYDEACEISTGDAYITDFVGGEEEQQDDMSDLDEPDDESSEDAEQDIAEDEESSDDDSEAEFDSENDNDDEFEPTDPEYDETEVPFVRDEDEESYGDEDEDDGSVEKDEPESEQEDAQESEAEPEVEQEPEDEELTPEVEDKFDETIIRRFFSDELGLEVSTEAFDSQFLHGNPYIPFDENRTEGWLNNQLNEMSRDANIDMKRLHEANLFELRSKFYNLLSLHAEHIQKDFDITNPETEFGQLMSEMDMSYAQALDGVEAKVAEKTDELKRAYNEAKEAFVADARAAAEKQYRERHGRQHEADVNAIPAAIKSEIEASRESGKREFMKDRKAKAARQMDLGVSLILQDISREYQKRLADESALCHEWRERINTFLDNNRKDDIARTKALAEELAQQEKADKVLAEYTEKLRAKDAEFEAHTRMLEQEVANDKKDMQKQIAEYKAECASKVEDVKKQKDDVQAKLDELMEQYAQIDERKGREYEARLAQAKDEAEAWSDKYDYLAAAHKKNNIFIVALAAVGVIAALTIGVLVGTNMNLGAQQQQTSTAITQDYQSRMDKIENSNNQAPQNNTNNKSGQ